MYVSRTNKSQEMSSRKNITWQEVIEQLKYKDEFGQEAVGLCLKEMNGDPFRTRFTHIRSKNHHSKEETKESVAMVGTMRALAINMIKGVSDGF